MAMSSKSRSRSKPRSKPTVAQLNKHLKDMIKWQEFALHLPGMKQRDIEVVKSNNKHDDIEEKKIALYQKWQKVYPSASWADVVKALEEAEEFAIAATIKKQFPRQFPAAAVSQSSSSGRTVTSSSKDKAKDSLDLLNSHGINIHQEQIEFAKQWISMGKRIYHDDDDQLLNIVLLGGTGTGKSALINSLLGAQIAVENDSCTPINYPEGVKSCSGSIEGVQVRCFDTNGFCGDEETLKSVVKGLKSFGVEPDLLVVCINITDNRFIPANFASQLNRLTQLYGVEKFWQKVIIAFTFTNQFELIQQAGGIAKSEIKVKLEKKANEICQVFHEELVIKTKTISSEVFNKIQACFVGRRRVGFSDDVKLVTSKDWWLDLFLAFSRVSFSPRLKFLSILERVYSSLDFKTAALGGGGFAATAFMISRFFQA